MRSTKMEFPHPMLADLRSDYTEGHFLLKLDNIETADNDFIFKFSYELSCSGIEKLIKEKRASTNIRIVCANTSYRKIAAFDSNHKCIIHIPKNDVAKKVEFRAFINTTELINKFSLPEHNQEYFKEAVFNLRKGDVLAESAIFTFRLDDSELEKPIDSIFIIRKASENSEESYFVSFSYDKIEIFIEKRLFDVYFNLRKKGAYRRYLSAVLVLPALVEAIDLMKTDSGDGTIDEYANKRWYMAIKNKLNKLQINLDETTLSSSGIGNKLLGNITFDALTSFKAAIDEYNDTEIIEDERRD